MTTICWDGNTLAADTLMSIGGDFTRTVKNYRLAIKDEKCAYWDGALIGFAGPALPKNEILHWFEELAMDPKQFTSAQLEDKTSMSVLIITTDKKVWFMETNPWPIEYKATQFAIGSGAPYARMAMKLGKSSLEAIQLVEEFDLYTRGPVNCLSFTEQHPTIGADNAAN